MKKRPKLAVKRKELNPPPNSIDISSLINVFSLSSIDTNYFDNIAYTIPFSGNPHIISTIDTVYAIVKTNGAASCADSAIAYIDVLPATNKIANQSPGNFSNE